MNAITPNSLDIRKISQPLPAAISSQPILSDLASQLAADLEPVISEYHYGVTAEEINAFCEAVNAGGNNGKAAVAALLNRLATSPRKLEFFIRLVSFLQDRTGDFGQKTGIVVSKGTLAKLLADNQQLQKILADYAAYKTGKLRLEVSDNRFLSISKDGLVISLNSLSDQEILDLADALQQGALEELRPLLVSLFNQQIAGLKKTADGEIEITFSGGKTARLTHKEAKLFSDIKKKMVDIKDAQKQGAEVEAEADMTALASQLQELAKLGYSAGAPDNKTAKQIRGLENQGIDFDSLQGNKDDNTAPILKKGDQPVVYQNYSASSHTDLMDALKQGAEEEPKPVLAGLLGKSADSIAKVSLADDVITIEFKSGSKTVISKKELELISRLNGAADKTAAGNELVPFGYQLTTPSTEMPKVKLTYQNTGKAKISAFRQALSPFEILTQVTIGLKSGSSEDALLANAGRLHAAIKNFKETFSYLYTTLTSLGLDLKVYEIYLKDDQKVLERITNETAFQELAAELVKLINDNLDKLNPDELTRKNIKARRDSLAGVKAEQIRFNQQLATALSSEIKINNTKAKMADVITALYEYARSAFRRGLPAEYVTLQFGSAADYNNLASFCNFVGRKSVEYAAPEAAEGDEAAKKAAETAFNARAEETGRLFWADRQAELRTALDFTPLPLPRLRGKVDSQLQFSDGLIRLLSLRAEALPGGYRSDAEALIRADILGHTIETSLAPLYQVIAAKTGLDINEIEKFFRALIEEKAQVVFVYNSVKQEPQFFYFKSGELKQLSKNEQKILRTFWETSYETELQDEKLTKKGRLTGAIENSFSYLSESEIQLSQIERLALQMAALCVNGSKVRDINNLPLQDIQEVLRLAYQLLSAGRNDEEIIKKFEADVKKKDDELKTARKNLNKQVGEANKNADDAEDNLFGASAEQIIASSNQLSEYRGRVAKGNSEQSKKINEFQENLDKATARLELAKFFIKGGRKLFGAEVNGQFLFMVASRVKFLLSELPKLSNVDLKAMLEQVTLPSSETYVLTPALLRGSIFAAAGNQFSKQNVAGQATTPDLWDQALLNDIPLVGKTKVTSEQGLYGIVLNHPATAVLAYLSDELHYDFWSELPQAAGKPVALNIQASISGDFLMRLGSHLVKKYGDRFQYMIAAGRFLNEKKIVLGDREVATPTAINPRALGLSADDSRAKAVTETLEFLNGVFQVSMRKFQPMEGDMLSRSFDLKDKSFGNRLSGIGRSTFKIPLSGAQKQLQTIIGQDIMLMREELGLPYPPSAGPESFEIDQKFVKALLDSPFSSYLRHSMTAGFFGQLGEKVESKIGREATSKPEEFLRAYLAEHPEFSFSLDLGFEDVIDERTAWAKLLIMKVLSNYAVSESNPASRAAKMLGGHLPEADTVFSIFIPQDMTDPGNWNRALNIFLYQAEQLVPVAGVTLKDNHEYTADQINFLGRKMLETVQNLPDESKQSILEQVNDIFSVTRQGKDKGSIEKGMASLEQVARLLADYRGGNLSFESIGLTGGFDQVRRALYTATRVFLPMMSARAKGEGESKVVAGRFLQHYRQELKKGHELIVENFITAPEKAGRFIHQEKAEESSIAVLGHSFTEMAHLHLFMHPEIMIGLQAGFLRGLGKAVAEGRHGDAVEIFWQQVNTLASFKAFELFPPALIASAVEKYKQGNGGGAIIQGFFALTAFQGLYRLTMAAWRGIKRGRFVLAEHGVGNNNQVVKARIARLEKALAELPAKMASLQQELTAWHGLMRQSAPVADVAAKAAEVLQAQAEVNDLLGRAKKNAESPLKTLEKAKKQLTKSRFHKTLDERLMADKYTRGGKAETRVNFEVFEADGTTSIATPKRGLGNRIKGLSPIRANNRVVDVIWNAEDLAVEGATLGGAKVFQNQDLARVTNLLEKMVELAKNGDRPIKVKFSSVSEGTAVIEIKPSQVVRSFYLQHMSVTNKIATLPDAVKLGKPVKGIVNLASKLIRGKEVHALPGTKEAAQAKLAGELTLQNPGNQTIVGKWLNSVQTEAAYCSTKWWTAPGKWLFNTRTGVTRIFAQFYRRLPKALRTSGPVNSQPVSPVPPQVPQPPRATEGTIEVTRSMIVDSKPAPEPVRTQATDGNLALAETAPVTVPQVSSDPAATQISAVFREAKAEALARINQLPVSDIERARMRKTAAAAWDAKLALVDKFLADKSNFEVEVKADYDRARSLYTEIKKLKADLRTASDKAALKGQLRILNAELEKVRLPLAKKVGAFVRAHGPMMVTIIALDMAMNWKEIKAEGTGKAAKVGLQALGGYFTFLAGQKALENTVGLVAKLSQAKLGGMVGAALAAGASVAEHQEHLASSDAATRAYASLAVATQALTGYISMEAGVHAGAWGGATAGPVGAAVAGTAASVLTYLLLTTAGKAVGADKWLGRKMTRGELIEAFRQVGERRDGGNVLAVKNDSTETSYFEQVVRTVEVGGEKVGLTSAQEFLGLMQAAQGFHKLPAEEQDSRLGKLLFSLNSIEKLTVDSYSDLTPELLEQVGAAINEFRSKNHIPADNNSRRTRFEVNFGAKRTVPVINPLTGEAVGRKTVAEIKLISVREDFSALATGNGWLRDYNTVDSATFAERTVKLEGDTAKIEAVAQLKASKAGAEARTYDVSLQELAGMDMMIPFDKIGLLPNAKQDLIDQLELLGYNAKNGAGQVDNDGLFRAYAGFLANEKRVELGRMLGTQFLPELTGALDIAAH